MPGKERTAADATREFVALARLPDANVRALSRRFGISPTTGHALPHRYAEYGEATSSLRQGLCRGLI